MAASAADEGRNWHFENRQTRTRLDEASICEFLQTLATDLSGGKQFSVVVTSDEELREANDRFRNVPLATDVLSFPDGEDGYLGDVMISADRAVEQAGTFGHPVEEEIRVLALHGMLHLNGYDHESDDGEMRREENRLRRRYGLTTALISRAGG